MEARARAELWGQFGAAIDMLENAIRACPEDVWGDRSRRPEYWYTAYHTLFWLDCYLDAAPDTFRPPEPFTLAEMDPSGVLPDRVYSKEELLRYLEHGRSKARAAIEGAGERLLLERRGLGASTQGTFSELLLYGMRHVQHHAAQLNLLLRQAVDSAPRWVARTR